MQQTSRAEKHQSDASRDFSSIIKIPFRDKMHSPATSKCYHVWLKMKTEYFKIEYTNINAEIERFKRHDIVPNAYRKTLKS